MSSGTVTPPPRSAEPQPGPASYEAFIDDRLRRARRQVKGVDVVGGAIVLLIGMLVYLLAAVLIDHWVISGGLGFWGRLLLLLGLLAGAGWYCARRVLMPLIFRINPIFAAYTIEQSRPSLKNSLINFLLLRGHRREVPQPIYQAIEHRAAADLSQIEIEAAVDRTRVIRLGYVLAGVVAVCGLYRVISPKNPFSSAARVLWPWSDIPAPTRVTIEDVKPGDAVAFHGEFVTVSAEVRGVDGDSVDLYYSTADGQSVGQRVPMTPPENGYPYQYECRLPPEKLGLQQDVYYYLTAGDFTTRRFTIHVQTAPAILIDQVEYDYPAYTGFSRQIVKRQGDLRAIEGTEVTIRGLANRTVHRAEIDLGCTGLRELTMQPKGRTATGRITLRLNPNDPNLPEYDCYQLRFRDDAGRLNPRPTRHKIEVIRDLPPEVQLVEPQQEEVPLAEGGRLEIRVRAQDPDFALKQVVLKAECGGRTLVIPPLLEKLHQGEFQQSYFFEPARGKFEGDSSQPAAGPLKAGDRVRYWAEALDNKEPTPGRGTTAQQWITIVKPQTGQPTQEKSGTGGQAAQPRSEDKQNTSPDGQAAQDQQARGNQPQGPAEKPQPEKQQSPKKGAAQDHGQQQEAPGQSQPGPQSEASEPGGGNGKPESGTSGQDHQQPPEGQADQPRKRIDPETQDGDAFDEILKDRQKQQAQGDQQVDKGQDAGAQKTQPQDGTKQEGGAKEGPPQGDKGQGAGPEKTEPQGATKQEGGAKEGSPQADKGQGAAPENAKPQGGTKQEGGAKNGQAEGAGKKQPAAAEKAEPQSGTKQERGPREGAPQETQEQSPGAAGKPSAEETPPPAAQGPNKPREKKVGEPGQNPGQSQQPAQSPSISRHQSDSPQGDTSGDRSGKGEQGGGQRSPQQGAGAAGSQTEAQQGASAGKQQGAGQTGTQRGNQVETSRQTGSSATRRGGPDSGGRQQPGGVGPAEKKSDGSDSTGAQRPQENPPEGGRPASGQPGNGSSSGPTARGQGNPTAGGGPGPQPAAATPRETGGAGGDEPNLDYARRATDLALEHLKDQMAKNNSELLDRLGWTREDARKFIQKWEQMKRAAAQQGPEGGAARKQLDQALKSLGLRPRGTQVQGGGTETDQLQDLREAGRFDPPSEWSEVFRAYIRGVATEGRE
jgi:collagen type III alpha